MDLDDLARLIETHDETFDTDGRGLLPLAKVFCLRIETRAVLQSWFCDVRSRNQKDASEILPNA